MKYERIVLKCYGCIHNMVVENAVSLFGDDRMDMVIAVGRSRSELIKHHLPFEYVFVMDEVSVTDGHRKYSLNDTIIR